MAEIDKDGVTSDVYARNMVYEPILEEGVFRFDCTSDDRSDAFPSLSFANPKVRDIPLMNEKRPSYIPTFERTQGQQIVLLQVNYLCFFPLTSWLLLYTRVRLYAIDTPLPPP
ncbi:unnamed protein product, partial [Amaranthus hypochondriacus]